MERDKEREREKKIERKKERRERERKREREREKKNDRERENEQEQTNTQTKSNNNKNRVLAFHLQTKFLNSRLDHVPTCEPSTFRNHDRYDLAPASLSSFQSENHQRFKKLLGCSLT